MNDRQLSMQPFPVYLINLDRSPDRLEFMQEQFAKLSVAYTRVVGTDGRAHIPDHLKDEFTDARLTSGEAGCYASHLHAMWRLLASTRYCAVVVEDDVVLDPDFAAVVERAVDAAWGEWDIIHLSTNGKKRPVVRLADIGDRALVRHGRVPVNTACYLVSRSGAEKMLSPGVRERPIDMEIRYAWLRDLNVLGVEPPPARQRKNQPSTIDYPAWRARNLSQKYYWAPSWPSRAYGWLYLKRRLGLYGTLSCWGQGLRRGLRKRAGLPQ
jgi:glycosyl transferase family 25